MEKLTIDEVKSVVATLSSLQTDESHRIEDDLNETFIKGINIKLYTLEEINEIASLLCGMLDMNLERWYA